MSIGTLLNIRTKAPGWNSLRTYALSIVVSLLCLAVAPLAVLAEDKEAYDARLLGYPQTVELESGSTGLTWFLLVILGVLTISVLFKDAKRTHLD